MKTEYNETYRVGSLITGQGAIGSGCQYPRPLIRESDEELVAIVDSDVGPVILGSMTADEVIDRWPHALDQ